ncbi:7-deoxyloganetic acid glucosyltransferase-like [Panicum miliaceum]|uniref:7-deoxyloganetic acid glucosyltransferase-like n=1 Tax=Panicum miliaceum TaxID=4540 RepID=A0A3L6QMB3_PANMI|nr:7-deoxyloganetic acid glucosyltransferase-like [Panicum miliaceum]
MRAVASVAYRALLASLQSTARPTRPDHHDGVDAHGGGFPPVTCVVADGYLSWTIDIADELGVPVLAFPTSSACSTLAYLSVPRLFELGELPFPAGGDLDEPVHGVPGMESFLRRRDLPSPFRPVGENGVNSRVHVLSKYTFHSGKARALILNTAASPGPAQGQGQQGRQPSA